MQVDLSRLDAASTEVRDRSATMVPLNLFDEWAVVFERVEKTDSGYALSGRLAGHPLSSVTMVVHGDIVAGMINSDEGTWHLRSRGAGLVEVRKQEGKFRCGMGPAVGESRGSYSGARKATAAQDDGDQIDVLVVFTEAARRRDGGWAQIRANIDLWVAVTNEAYRASGAQQRINLVAAVQVDYQESKTHGSAGLRNQREDLDRLKGESDGYMDEVHALRDSYAADIVYLIVFQPHGGGRGLILSLEDPDPASSAFAISNSHTELFPHELGHVMGLQHDRYSLGDYISNTPYPYSHGYVNQEAFAEGASDEKRWVTIMAYDSQCSDAGIGCREIMRFSNPDQRYPAGDGDPLGVPGDQPSEAVDGPADAVRSLNNTRSIVANFRPSSTRCAYELSRTEHVVAASGGSFSIQVKTETRCPWSTRAFDDFLSVDTSEEKAGNGDMVYHVMPNQGTARVGYITVAGETLAIYQSGSTASTLACDRTAAVRNAIGRAANRNTCSAVTEFDLLEIGSLDLSSKGITALRTGDFDGLDNLSELDLSNNRITSLPEGAFRDLTSLTWLSIGGNRLDHLPKGVFPNLSNLENLDLSHNSLTALSADVFSGLTKLERLQLDQNELPSLPDGIFSDLGQLRYLELRSNQLSGLRKEMFEGPDVLFWLVLSDNPLITVPEDLFSKSNIAYLSLANTRLSVIPPRLFRNLEYLWILDLNNNQIATLPPRVFPGGNIERLSIRNNRLQVLPQELFLGFTSEFCTRRNMHLDLQGNPGSPFPLELEVVRLDAGPAAEGPASIAVRVVESTPLPLTVGLSATGGSLSRPEATVPTGSVQSEPIEVEGNGPVTVRLEAEPELPPTYKGITIELGEPLRLFALQDQTLEARGVPFTLDLAAALAPANGEQSYTAGSTNAEVATAIVEESTLIIHPISDGTTTVRVTATGEDGSTVVRTFMVTVSFQVDLSATLRMDSDNPVALAERSLHLYTGLRIAQGGATNVQLIWSASLPLRLDEIIKSGPNFPCEVVETTELTGTLACGDVEEQNRELGISLVFTPLQAGSLDFSVAFSSDEREIEPADNVRALRRFIAQAPHPQTLAIVSGGDQQALVGTALENAFVVSVLDQKGEPFPGASVTFAVTAGDGTLSVETAITDSMGLASSTLTLGQGPGTHAVEVTVADLEPVTFTALAQATPDFNGDGVTDFGDFFLFADAFGSTDARFDLDGSGVVDFGDFFLFADAFGQPARAKLLAMAAELIGLPEGPQLQQNRPNPFNSGTVISWFQLHPGRVRLEVFALTGQRVAVLHQGKLQAGVHHLHWDGRDKEGRPLASGVYLYRLVTAEGTRTLKLALLR